MLEGLEISEISLSALERTKRLDAEYFLKEHLINAALLQKQGTTTITSCTNVSDGNHFSVSDNFVDEGFPYYRGQDVVGHFFIEQSTPVSITEAAYNEHYMKRSHLKKGDVLLSIVGSIGEASLVSSDKAATCSCKLAILRPKTIEPAYLASFLRCKYGRQQTQRLTRGAVQMGLLLEDMDQVLVPELLESFEKIIAKVTENSKIAIEKAESSMAQAELTLLHALGIENQQAPEPLSYVRNSLDAFTTGRLDAEYFAPRVSELLKRLGRDKLCIADLAPPRRQRFKPARDGHFDYIEIGGLRQDGTAEAEQVLQSEAPSRATQIVASADVITSTVRPIRRLSALITPEQNGFVCSSGFVVLQPEKIAPEVLLTYLRLKPVCELMDLHTSASLYPAISEQDLLSLPIPRIDQETQKAVSAAVQAAQQSRHRATQLLDAAKRAVEIAIEDSEAAALAYLEGVHP